MEIDTSSLRMIIGSLKKIYKSTGDNLAIIRLEICTISERLLMTNAMFDTNASLNTLDRIMLVY